MVVYWPHMSSCDGKVAKMLRMMSQKELFDYQTIPPALPAWRGLNPSTNACISHVNHIFLIIFGKAPLNQLVHYKNDDEKIQKFLNVIFKKNYF